MAEDQNKNIAVLATETPDPRTFLVFKTLAKFEEKLASGRVDPNKHFAAILDERLWWVRGKLIADNGKLDDFNSYYNDWELIQNSGTTIDITLKGNEWNSVNRIWEAISKKFTINAATQSIAGLQSAADKLKEDRITRTNHTISNTSTANDRTIKLTAINPTDNSDASTATTIPSATQLDAGLLNTVDKKAIDNIHASAWSHIDDTNTFTATANEVSLNYTCRSSGQESSSDSSVHSQPIGAVSSSRAGVMIAQDKIELDRVTTANFGLTGITPNEDTVTINTSRLNINTNATGNTDQTIPAATSQKAGVMTSTDKTEFDRVSTANFDVTAVTSNASTVTISATKTNITNGSAVDDTFVIPESTTTLAGTASAQDKITLTNTRTIGTETHIKDTAFTTDATKVTLNYENISSTTKDATVVAKNPELPIASNTQSGIITAAQHAKFNEHYSFTKVAGDSGTAVADIYDDTITFKGSGDATGGITTAASDTDDTVTITHKAVTRTNTTDTNANITIPSEGSTVNLPGVISSVTSSATGHVTGANTKTIPILHGATTRTNTDTTNTTTVTIPASGAEIKLKDPVTNITTSSTGHVTGVTKENITVLHGGTTRTDTDTATSTTTIPSDGTSASMTRMIKTVSSDNGHITGTISEQVSLKHGDTTRSAETSAVNTTTTTIPADGIAVNTPAVLNSVSSNTQGHVTASAKTQLPLAHAKVTHTPGTGAVVTAITTNNGHVTADTKGNLSGDVTTNNSLATTISNNVVSNAKLADMGANTIKGAVTAGDPQDLTPAQVKTMLNLSDNTSKDIADLAEKFRAFLEDAGTKDGTIDSWHEIENFLSGITDTQTLTGVIQSAIQALDSSIAAEANKYIDSITITDGKISAHTKKFISEALLTNYTKGTSTATVTASDSVNSAIAKLENQIDAAKSTASSNYVTALGTSGNYLTWTKNGGVNNITVPYATNADTVDGFHETAFMRSFWTNNPGWDMNDYTNTRPFISFTYSTNAPFTGAFADINANGYGFFLGTTYNSDGALYYRRHGRDSDGGIGNWQQLARITDNVASASKLATPHTLWGQSFDGTANVSGNMTGVGTISASGSITGSSFIKSGGTSTQFLKADGSIDSNTYLSTKGGTLDNLSFISWKDSGHYNTEFSDYPYTTGGLVWNGVSDWIRLYAKEEKTDDLRLVLHFGDNGDESLDIVSNIYTNGQSVGEKTTARILGTGEFQGQKFVKLGGTSDQLLKADGDVQKLSDLATVAQITELAGQIYYFHASAGISIRDSANVNAVSIIEKGVNTTLTINGSSSFMTGGAKETVIVNRTSGDTQVARGTTSASGTVTINDTTTFLVTATFNYNVTKTASATVNAYYPIYSLHSTASTLTESDIISGTKYVKASPAGSYTMNVSKNGSYFWICVPSTMTINKVTLSGFDVPMTVVNSNFAVSGKGTYKLYRSTSSNDAGTHTLVVS